MIHELEPGVVRLRRTFLPADSITRVLPFRDESGLQLPAKLHVATER